MKPARKKPARATVVVQESDEPMDLTAFVELYVELVLEAEGVRVAEREPARRMGS